MIAPSMDLLLRERSNWPRLPAATLCRNRSPKVARCRTKSLSRGKRIWKIRPKTAPARSLAPATAPIVSQSVANCRTKPPIRGRRHAKFRPKTPKSLSCDTATTSATPPPTTALKLGQPTMRNRFARERTEGSKLQRPATRLGILASRRQGRLFFNRRLRRFSQISETGCFEAQISSSLLTFVQICENRRNLRLKKVPCRTKVADLKTEN